MFYEIMEVNIIGAGIAGSEAAYFLANKDIKINLFEMRPERFTPAHKTSNFAELVCSNSLRSISSEHPAGILKNELDKLDSVIISSAKKFSVPGGNALTVDREKFSLYITDLLENHPNINVIRQEYTEMPHKGITIIATGPLTSETLSEKIMNITGREQFYFYDAIAPIVEADSIDMNKAFFGNRYDMGNKDYINCPLTEEEYFKFVGALQTAEIYPFKDFEKSVHFDGCMPIEEMISKGELTLAFGPMKPVGLINPETGKEPFAVVQLRKENREGTAYNLVGFQTKMTIPEQERILRLIPALKNAVFLRYGSLHRNIYINSPEVLNDKLSFKNMNNVFIAGQISGVEGYIESAAQGLLTAMIVYSEIKGFTFDFPDKKTAIGALYHFLREKKKKFVPSNINFGLFEYGTKVKRIRNKRKRKEVLSREAEKIFEEWLARFNLTKNGYCIT